MLRLTLLLALFALILLIGLSTDLFDRVTPEGVRGWVHRAGAWAPAVYVAAFAARPFTLVPLTPWLLAGGVAFGWLPGAVFALLGVNLGAAVTFLTARTLGRDAVERLFWRRRRAPEGPRVWGTRLVLSLQLFPLMPHDLLNAAAGCSGIPYWRFLLGSSLGTLPFVFLYTYAGSVLTDPGSGRFFVAFAALGGLSLLSLLLARRARRGDGASKAAPVEAAPTPAAPDDSEIGFSVFGEPR